MVHVFSSRVVSIVSRCLALEIPSLHEHQHFHVLRAASSHSPSVEKKKPAASLVMSSTSVVQREECLKMSLVLRWLGDRMRWLYMPSGSRLRMYKTTRMVSMVLGSRAFCFPPHQTKTERDDRMCSPACVWRFKSTESVFDVLGSCAFSSCLLSRRRDLGSDGCFAVRLCDLRKYILKTGHVWTGVRLGRSIYRNSKQIPEDIQTWTWRGLWLVYKSRVECLSSPLLSIHYIFR